MTQSVQSYREPDVTPVGHTGTRVEIPSGKHGP